MGEAIGGALQGLFQAIQQGSGQQRRQDQIDQQNQLQRIQLLRLFQNDRASQGRATDTARLNQKQDARAELASIEGTKLFGLNEEAALHSRDRRGTVEGQTDAESAARLRANTLSGDRSQFELEQARAGVKRGDRARRLQAERDAQDVLNQRGASLVERLVPNLGLLGDEELEQAAGLIDAVEQGAVSEEALGSLQQMLLGRPIEGLKSLNVTGPFPSAEPLLGQSLAASGRRKSSSTADQEEARVALKEIRDLIPELFTEEGTGAAVSREALSALPGGEQFIPFLDQIEDLQHRSFGIDPSTVAGLPDLLAQQERIATEGPNRGQSLFDRATDFAGDVFGTSVSDLIEVPLAGAAALGFEGPLESFQEKRAQGREVRQGEAENFGTLFQGRLEEPGMAYDPAVDGVVPIEEFSFKLDEEDRRLVYFGQKGNPLVRGLPEEEREALLALPEGQRLFQEFTLFLGVDPVGNAIQNLGEVSISGALAGGKGVLGPAGRKIAGSKIGQNIGGRISKLFGRTNSTRATVPSSSFPRAGAAPSSVTNQFNPKSLDSIQIGNPLFGRAAQGARGASPRIPQLPDVSKALGRGGSPSLPAPRGLGGGGQGFTPGARRLATPQGLGGAGRNLTNPGAASRSVQQAGPRFLPRAATRPSGGPGKQLTAEETEFLRKALAEAFRGVR